MYDIVVLLNQLSDWLFLLGHEQVIISGNKAEIGMKLITKGKAVTHD